jgi:rubrerythrin
MTTEAEAKQRVIESIMAWQKKEGHKRPSDLRQRCRRCGLVFIPDDDVRTCPYCGAKNPRWRR